MDKARITRQRLDTDAGPLLISILPAVGKATDTTVRPALRVESLDGPEGGLRIGRRRINLDSAWHRDRTSGAWVGGDYSAYMFRRDFMPVDLPTHLTEEGATAAEAALQAFEEIRPDWEQASVQMLRKERLRKARGQRDDIARALATGQARARDLQNRLDHLAAPDRFGVVIETAIGPLRVDVHAARRLNVNRVDRIITPDTALVTVTTALPNSTRPTYATVAGDRCSITATYGRAITDEGTSVKLGDWKRHHREVRTTRRSHVTDSTVLQLVDAALLGTLAQLEQQAPGWAWASLRGFYEVELAQAARQLESDAERLAQADKALGTVRGSLLSAA